MAAFSKVLTSIALIMTAVIPAQAEYQSTLSWSSPAELQSADVQSYWILESTESQPFGAQYIAIIPKTAAGEVSGYSYDIVTNAFTCYKINVFTNDYVLHHANSEVCINPPIDPPAFCPGAF